MISKNNKTMRLIKRYQVKRCGISTDPVIERINRYAAAARNSHGGKRKGSGRPRIDPKKKKKPITTWLAPLEIKHLKNMGKDAQDGIRTLVHRSVGPLKKSRNEQSINNNKLIVRRKLYCRTTSSYSLLD